MSNDRHIRRSGDDYGQALADLLPRGPAWSRKSESVLIKAVYGLAQIFGFVDQRAADLLETESDPRITVELLPDWERNWGLPDPCYAEPLSVYDRQVALVQRMTIMGDQSRQFFINTAAQIGYTITITEYRPFMVGLDRVGDNRTVGDGLVHRNEWGHVIVDPLGDTLDLGEMSEYPYVLGPDINRYYWTVHVRNARLTWFRCASGECGVDPHLRIGLATDLECLLNRWKPAHTQIIFDYANLESGGSMDGTP